MASCNHCHNLELYHLNIKTQALQEGIKSGCAACTVLRQSIDFFAAPDDEVFAIELLVERALYVSLFTKKGVYLKTLELYTEISKPCIWPKIGPGRAVSTDPSSEQCIDLAKNWLKICLRNHPICQPPETTPLPTRVIDVGNTSSEVRLYVTKGENVQYAALSHCWGTSRVPIATTAESLDDRMRSVQFDLASQTFADAVSITRRLSIRYLWIDSLCIIQKDEDDWATEAGRMSEIFRNATIVLSADAAEDTSQGLFTTPAKRLLKQNLFSIPVAGPAGDSIIYVRSRAKNPTDPESPPHSSIAQEGTKLSTRGWVVQERLLATRMLHFYEEEMVWSCSSLARCECRHQPSISPSAAFRRMVTTAGSQGSIELMTEWSRIVKELTSKHLTFAKDRLPAIAGLAGLVDRAVSSRYNYGLWSGDIAYQLLWVSNHKQDVRTVRCPPEAHAPSWSWASITGPIQYIDRYRTSLEHRTGRAEVKPLLKVTLVSTTPSGPNPYGPSRRGCLTVTGQLLPVYFIFETGKPVWRPLVQPFFHEDPTVEPQVTFDVLDEGLRVVPDDHGTYSVFFPEHDYFFLRAGTYISGGVWSTASRENVCLLLWRLPYTLDGRDVFKRVGFVLFGFSSDTVWQSLGAPEETLFIV